ncbi:hemagglutinin [Microbacterium radiodurans]|uniref:Hemagglutinin n=1 Tax=Microbacterium radiodurans TaxID=661398 RepID=A0A5J5IQ85_9MICO|nr:hemagglutinin [Microbacterium radiodurans]KAA9084107.1 hemagglutinin [Microbacterium radiodurans]
MVSRTRLRRRRRRIAIVTTLILVPTLFVALIVAIGTTTATIIAAVPDRPVSDDPALPPNAGEIDPGNLIDDALFYDDDAMTTDEIQRFLDDRIGSCANDRCLNVVTAGISSRPARVSERTGEVVCRAVEGGELRVAEIIDRMQRACGISARVILVTLQKEQSLVSGRAARAPSEARLRTAMGASCPDDAPCDPAYEGVGAQIVAGTTDLASYRASRFMRQPGTHFIGFHPNRDCGGTDVVIENDATAALYNYTPYQPNDAAMSAGWGTGDACSSYGNRNFSYYFALWFGSVRAG